MTVDQPLQGDVTAHRTRPVPLTDDSEHRAVPGEDGGDPVFPLQLHQLVEQLLSGWSELFSDVETAAPQLGLVSKQEVAVGAGAAG